MKNKISILGSNHSSLFRGTMLALLIMLGTNSIFAQSITIKGTVTDMDGMPLPAANIIEKGTQNGAVSDFDGLYTISAPKGSTLVFSFIGFSPKEVVVGNQTTINVSLAGANTLDEVVIIGYGTTKKSDLTGSISSVGAKDFEKQPVFRVEDALQGRASGVQISKNSGAPGAAIKIRIRGANSISSNNQPLVVIDGIIGGDLTGINTNDIESMEILKDASATAIYGSRGANGVILVTTKKGKGDAKVNISYFTSISKVPDFIDVLAAQEFADIHGITFEGQGENYQDRYFQTGITQNTQVSLSGSEGKIGYFISGNLVDQTGVTINTNYKRYSLRSNLSAKINDKFSVNLNLTGSIEKSLNLVAGGARTSSDRRGGLTAVLGWDPTTPLRDANGNYNLTSTNAVGLVNPIAVREQSDAKLTKNNFDANLTANYKITDNLSYTFIGGLLHRNRVIESYRGIPAGSSVELPKVGAAFGSSLALQNSNILTWHKEYGKNNIKLTGIYEVQSSQNRGFSASGGPLAIPGNFFSLRLGMTPGVNATLSENTMKSWIGRGEYNYNGALFITGTIRSDESSKFRKGNRTGIFPSLSAAYNLWSILPENSFIANLKVRAGYGETGNQSIAPYSTYNTISTTSANFPLNGLDESVGIKLGDTGNPDLTWETTKQSNIGIDFSIFEGRVKLSADAYKKNTTDLLLAVPITGYNGGGKFLENIGEVSNTGFEFTIDGTVFDKEQFSWSSSFNFTTNKNKVEKLAGDQQQMIIDPVGNMSNSTGGMGIIKVGEPLGQFYGATFLGTYKTGDTDGTPGSAKYLRDTDGELVLGIIGNGTPDYTWGFNNTLTYNKIDLNILFTGSHGFDVLNLTRAQISMAGGNVNNATIGEYRNRWTPENQTNIPATGNNFVNSTRYVEDGSFIRLSNIALGYNLSNIKGFDTIRIYASAQNLFTLTDYKGYDPEASSTSASSDAGSSIDWGAFPNPRTFTFGINIGL
ncbi:MAG: SusC/RagA family TonB-linked outer membrane protein [Flavobacteriaceae bacterium]|nr:MAG: SusC/RagA family TonB-linked outer membrane protein [Flavobacteriaceae bacterium]